MLTLLRSLIPSAISCALGIVAGAFPAARALVSAHPERTILALGAWGIICHILPSPVPKFKAIGD